MNIKTVLALLGISLFACLPAHAVSFSETLAEIDSLTEQAPMTINPGAEFEIEGKRVRVFGNEPCPDPSRVLVYYIGTPSSGSGCVMIQPDTKNIIVQRKTEQGLTPEVWRVEHAEGTYSLWTKDGKPVRP